MQKNTHVNTHTPHNFSIRSEKGSRSKCQFWNSSRWPIYVINPVDNTKLLSSFSPKLLPVCFSELSTSPPIPLHYQPSNYAFYKKRKIYMYFPDSRLVVVWANL